MATLITLAFLVLCIIICYTDWDDVLFGFFAFLFAISLIVTAIVGVNVTNGRTLNAKIAMYEEENQRIEQEINVLVEQYMNYEASTYGDLKGESSITLVSLYPELKSDTLVQRQIEVYIDNNSQIRKLKEKLIELSVLKWWLYFGK